MVLPEPEAPPRPAWLRESWRQCRHTHGGNYPENTHRGAGQWGLGCEDTQWGHTGGTMQWGHAVGPGSGARQSGWAVDAGTDPPRETSQTSLEPQDSFQRAPSWRQDQQTGGGRGGHGGVLGPSPHPLAPEPGLGLSGQQSDVYEGAHGGSLWQPCFL